MHPGHILRNHYKIIKELGRGNFGITYLAEDLDLPGNPLCVVKNLLQSQNPEELQDFIAFFDKEAKALSRLGNECSQIPRLFAHFQEGGEFYLVQEYVDGHDLSQEIFPDNKLSEAQVTQLLIEILEVLAFVHSNNIIHRDIKAQNLMRRHSDGKIVLIDFGAVKEINQLRTNFQELTNATARIGTEGYMPYEQFCGYPKLSSDVYAVGMLGIYALTGIKPKHLPTDADKFHEVIWQDKVSVSSQLVNVLDKMVRSNFKERYQNAGEALQALQIISSESTTPTVSLAPGLSSVSLPVSFPGLNNVLNKRFFISFGVVFSLVFGVVILFPFLSGKLKANAQICLAVMDFIPTQFQTELKDNESKKFYTLYGDMKDSKFNGCGIWIASSGNRYQGIFTDSNLNGIGKLFLSQNGDEYEYEGNFQKNQFHGEGVLNLSKSTKNNYLHTYKGSFQNRKKNGFGEFLDSNGCRYVGEFKDDKFHGKGTCTTKNDVRIGTWDKGELKGTNQTCCDNSNY
ncbi:protein kinase domain-containing protein [Rivularia sp. UHCC 0363]|uniref:protein kinase domain-containing protein n=1 Tax=Rivularia sp. UHCC 0363 TaxID=3110244 RepID=UPI002B2184B0|nr:protein kinase [Rivularia sp. UHCC 0363]MEA5597115.1 protein kinase [Rivularia sp. UHCC 0363]